MTGLASGGAALADVPQVWRAEPSDAQAVTRLLVEFRDHMGHSSPSDASFAASVQRLVAGPDAEFWLAGGADRQAAAVCQLRFRFSVWTAAEDCWLEDLFVRAAARRRGLARALVQRSLERARERGCRRVELDTHEDNHGALRLYECLGFSSTSKGPSRSLFLGVAIDRATT
jgi:GNAT superfamily N-acetyltransferase